MDLSIETHLSCKYDILIGYNCSLERIANVDGLCSSHCNLPLVSLFALFHGYNLSFEQFIWT
jgi:hypothetical protein